MKLIMNETKCLNEIFESGVVNKDINSGYLIRLLVLTNREKYTEEKEMVNFISAKCKELKITNYVEYKFDTKIKKIVHSMWENESVLRDLEYIPLYQSELEIIKSCNADREKKILFVCYIIARLYNTEWVNISDKDLFEMANMTMVNKDRQLFLYNMIQNGYLSQSKKNQNLAIKVNNIGKDSEKIVYKAESFDNLGNQLLVLLKSGYKQCVECGKLIRINSKTKVEKYCKNCRDNIRDEKRKLYNSNYYDKIRKDRI